jgi:hypothetical protein
LIREGHPDLALKVLHKYDEVMPDINIEMHTLSSKFFITQSAYQLHDFALGSKYINSLDSYLVDQLDYYYTQLQGNTNTFNPRDAQLGIQLIGAMADLTKDNHQTALANKLQSQAKDYETKFSAIFRQQ